jgi:hypothetical protein
MRRAGSATVKQGRDRLRGALLVFDVVSWMISSVCALTHRHRITAVFRSSLSAPLLAFLLARFANPIDHHLASTTACTNLRNQIV